MKRATIAGAVFGSLILAGLTACVNTDQSNSTPKPQEVTPAQQRQITDTLEKQRQAQLKASAEARKTENQAEERGLRAVIGAASVIDAARNPDSVKFDSVLVMKDGTTCYAYRAQNGFGGMNREHAVLLAKGDHLQQSATAWNSHCANKQGTDVTHNVNMLARLAR